MLRTALLLLLSVLALPAAADPRRVSALCEAAGAYAARAEGVPEAVLRAVALTETGRVFAGRNRPWPWTVNMEGEGKWFATREDALAYVRAHHARGARSYDVGCFQINYRWHGQAFASVEEMFDPRANALYAARFLRSLYPESGSWTTAAGAYHSRTPKYATRYAARFARILAGLGSETPSPPAQGAEYAHGMTPAESLETFADPAREPRRPRRARPGPLLADVPEGWVPPPPSATGSLAAVEHLPAGTPLLTAPRGSLF